MITYTNHFLVFHPFRYLYKIIEGNTNSKFVINSANGQILTGNQGLDTNVRNTYNITVQAQNIDQDCQKARIRINIQIISTHITFQMIPYLAINENESVGKMVGKVRATGGTGPLQYSIERGNSQQNFRINSATGQIFLNQPLDYESTQSYSISIQATSTGSAITANTNISIEIQDINEQPYFTTPCAKMSTGCTFTIAENAQASTIGVIQAKDPDLPTTPNGILHYQIVSNSIYFSVLSDGSLLSTRPLDREFRGSYTLRLKLTDSCHRCSLSASTKIHILVTDVNDNSPVFTSSPASIYINEDLQNYTIIGEYTATDYDVGSNAIISMMLSPIGIPFVINSMGILALTGSLDYETTESYSITITASNPGTTLSATTTTTIQILNVNDNTPVIAGEPYNISVAENSPINTLLTTVRASDGDLGIHGDIRFTITSGNRNQPFSLNSVSGRLTLRKNMDREMISSFSLAVRARDRGTPHTRQDTTTISVTVTDVNDNAPIFRPDTYSVHLREDIPVGRNVIRVLATDADQPNTPNSIIAYSITSGNTDNAFRISSSSGQIQTNQNLDFETTSSYTLVVEGRDGGSSVMSSTATVTVTVINVNENPPTLTGDQSVNISESTPVGSTVAVFLAQGQGQMTITINIISGNTDGTFLINTKTGIITITKSLDYETTTSYFLMISATDGQQNSDSSLKINIEDENEFSPVFSGIFNFETIENSSSGTVVGKITATDGDRDTHITYKLISQSLTSQLFSINQTTGILVTNRVLDREDLTSVFIPPLSWVTLQVAATDNGSPARQSFRGYTITLVDINDNTPTFSDATYSNQLRENLPAGQLVFSSSASDTDLGTNAQIRFSFVLTNNQGSSNPFQIDQGTGVITTTMPLDCEVQPFYLFSIIATDAGSPPRSSTVTGNLTLIDENDNAPQFSQDIFIINIREDFPPGVLKTFNVSDNDKGENGDVEFSIIQSNIIIFIEGERSGVIFRINKDTGALRSASFFNFELSHQVNVTVIASDKGLPSRTATTLLIINIINVDEQKPRFQTASCDATISEDAVIGTVLVTCSAIDSDSIATGNEPPFVISLSSNFFEVNSINGTITTKAALDREIYSVIGLTLQVKDFSGQISTKLLRISLSDINDNFPQFQSSSFAYHFTNEDIRRHKQDFLTVHATDPDFGKNGTVLYKIGKQYILNESVTLVEVIAQDEGTPQKASTVNVTVSFQSLCRVQTYTISQTEGLVSAYLLCSITVIPMEHISMVLSGSKTLACIIVQNSPTIYQWLHNGTALTNPELIPPETQEETFYLTDITYNNGGEYACRASSSAGGLQSSASMATIQGKILL